MATPRVTLDPAPLAAHLRYIMRRDGTGRRQTARNLGMQDRLFRRIVDGETEAVQIKVVDRALTADGVHLREIYPEWYERSAA